MDINEKADILGALYGEICDISETENGIMLTLDANTYKPYYSQSFLKCELINCREFLLKLNGNQSIKNLDEFKKYEIEINNTEFRNNKLIVNCLINKNWARIFIETETIKVYDELNKEIFPLEFLIMSGFCSSGVGIDFYIGNSIKDAENNENVKFNEELIQYLRREELYWHRYEKRGPKKEIDLLIGLDEYGDKIFSMDEIIQMIKICDGLFSKYKTTNLNDQKIRYFARKLKEICEEARLKDKKIIAVGD